MVTAIHKVTSSTPRTPPVPANPQLDVGVAGINALDFVRDNRIHIKHGSQFIDGYLVIHPRELAPANEPALREKLKLTFNVQHPTFFEDNAQRSIAYTLSSIIPTSLAAKHAQQQANIAAINKEVETGVDARLAQQRAERAQPMAANLREVTTKPPQDAVSLEARKNGLSLYLLMRDKLTHAGFMNPLASYVPANATSDQLLTSLGQKLGFTPLAMRDAAAKDGLAGVAKVLGVAPSRLNEIQQVVELAAQKGFSLNTVLNWNVGSQISPASASLEQKLAQGQASRIDTTISKARERARHHFDVPAAISAEEKRVAQSLEVLEPIQRAVMHKLGYEICYSPDYVPRDIAFLDGIKGLNRHTYNDPRSTLGTKRIYYSAYDGLQESTCILAHEAAHVLWPSQFAPAEVQHIDALAASDAARFKNLGKLVDEKFPEFEKFLRAYQAGNDAEKAAIKQTTNAYFAGYGVSIGDGLLPYLRDANQLRYLVQYANEKLHVEGQFYTGSIYADAPTRFREVISRFAELKQVRLRGEPELMQFLAPGLNQVWENHYLPHLSRVYAQAMNEEKAGGAAQHAPHATNAASQAGASEYVPSTSIATEGAQLEGVGLSNPAIAAANSVLSSMSVGR